MKGSSGQGNRNSHLTLVVADNSAAVGLNDLSQLRGGPVAVRNPARELAVPHAVVSAQELPVVFGKVGDGVAVRELEGSARRLSRVLDERISAPSRTCHGL